MSRRRLVAALFAAAVVSLGWAMLPPRARRLSLPQDPRLVRGAVHVHTSRSDGAGTPDAVASAAREAGLDFVVLTDHGDGTRKPDPPRYQDGVLLVDAVEISTDTGHYVALGIGQAPYRLAGEARDVIEDVHRLGGFGFAAHPDSRKPVLRWRDWSAPLDGLEWLNADSEWRHETRPALARAFVAYWFRGPEAIVSLFERPVSTLERWDRLAAEHPIVGLAALDAHARLPLEANGEPREGRSLAVPSYVNAFRALAVRVRLPAPLGRQDPAADASSVLQAIRAGHVFTVIDAIAGPAALDVRAESAGGRADMGDELVGPGPVRITASLAPRVDDATLVLIRNGVVMSSSTTGSLQATRGRDEPPATYRVEVRLPGAPGTPAVPWIVGNPVYVRGEPRPGPAAPPRAEIVRVLTEGSRPWTVERQPASEGKVGPGHAPDGSVASHFAWRLADGAPSGQYAALALPITKADLEGADAVGLTLQAAHPMRLSVQLRMPERGGLRWKRSVYVEPTGREVIVPLAEMTPIEAGPGARLDVTRADTLLLVVDTVNATPGSAGECWVGRVAAVRLARDERPLTSAP